MSLQIYYAISFQLSARKKSHSVFSTPGSGLVS